MTYVPPTAADLKARFPEFTAVSNTLIDLILAEAIPQVGESWLERDRRPATLYLAAHLLAMEGEPGRTLRGASGATAGTGPVKRFKVGDVETEFAGNGTSAGGGASSFASTEYGLRFLDLMRRNFPAVAVV
ncbi:MAG: DUF4054 domain-containing protein [Mesorhizobium sp.]|nr:DUF4054 domain-containing protein [Mesorhizobium sp.]MCO5085149.1 DUF4054 domain-containing protein [Rhizobiaceae bacterium]MCO5164674.1 DUF4054 domain-containing protein [Mesorhizobium sp.]